MNRKYLLSSLGIHALIALLLTPLLLRTPPQAKRMEEVSSVEFQKVSPLDGFAKKNRMQRITVTAKRDTVRPLRKSSKT